MAKGGGMAATQTQVQDVPEWAKPSYLKLLSATEGQIFDTTKGPDGKEQISFKPYQPYTGQRIATVGPDITASQNMVRNIAGSQIPGFAGAMSTMGNLGQQAGALGTNFDPTRQFSGQEVQQYMSPYMEAVMSRQEDEAIRQAGRQRAGRAAQAVGAGAFGGSRQAVQESLAEEALGRQLGDIRATGLQSAYEAAARQFESDRAAQAEQERWQREFQLQTMGFSADMASQIANLGERARAGDIQAAQLLEAQGLGQLARDQASLDVAYEDFLRQQDYPFQQLSRFSSMLRGLPIEDARTTTTYQPQPSLGQQLTGAGISGLSLYKAFQ